MMAKPNEMAIPSVPVLKPGMTHLKARDYDGQEISLKDTCYNTVERIFFRLNF